MSLSQRAAPGASRPADLAALAGLLAVSAAAAGWGAAATLANVATWYAGLAKPAFNPPNWLFGPAWTVLYIAMAVAAWRVWRTRSRGPVGPALVVYGVQMALNAVWSPVFFGLHRVGLALADILALLVMVAVTLVMFWKRDRVAGALMAPYLAWVCFATLLNFAIWRLN